MRLTTILTTAAALALIACASETASTTTPPPAARSDLGPAPATTASGTIESFTRTPAGEPDGFVLASGQRVRVPVALGAQMTDRFPANTQVTVSGKLHTDPDGRQVIDADQLTNPTSNATLDIAALRGAPSVPPASGVGGSGPVDPQRPMTTPVPPAETPRN